MRVEYQLILDDFDCELGAASELVLATDSPSSFGAEARVSLANCVTLLLASIFEEYVRQLVRAGWQQKCLLAEDLAAFPEKLRSKLWRSGMERVARLTLEKDLSGARSRVEGLIRFCIDEDLNADVEKDISHNDVNMRPGEIGRLFNQIGVLDIIGKASGKQAILDHFGEENAGVAAVSCRAALEDFFERRNTIAHALTFGSSGGATSLNNDISFMKAMALGLAEALDAD